MITTQTRRTDLSGQNFGRYVVLSDSGKRQPSSGEILWLCCCECGAEKLVSRSNLKRDENAKCGHLNGRSKHKGQFKDLAGERFGRLEVLADSGKRQLGSILWQCRCECGVEKFVPARSLNSGAVLSCGCHKREQTSKAHTRHGHSQRSGKASRTYMCWAAMRQRCTNPNVKGYARYGGRGITFAESWNDFRNFLADMGEMPDGLTLERIDLNKGYSPENCRWATLAEQSRNTSRNVTLTYQGKSQTISEWAREVGLSPSSLGRRIRDGWSVERALTQSAITNAAKDSQAVAERHSEQLKPIYESVVATLGAAGLDFEALASFHFRQKSGGVR